MKISNEQHRDRMAQRSLRQRERSKYASRRRIKLNRSDDWVECKTYTEAREDAIYRGAEVQHRAVR